MATWAECITKVKDHLWRSDLADSLVHDHLVAAMRYIEGWNKRRWHWLESVQTTSTADEQLSVPTDFHSAYTLAISDDGGNSFYPLAPRPVGLLHIVFPADQTGQPIEYWYQSNQGATGVFHLRPRPDREYTFKLHYRARLTEIEGADTNILTQNYPLALVYRACETLADTALKDEADAARYRKQFLLQMESMEDEDDDKRSDLLGGMVQPDLSYYTEAYGLHGRTS
jgi:hypothetical protein